MVCVALLFSILVTSVLAPGVIGQDATGADDQRPPEETADAIVDPQIVSVEGQDGDPVDSRLAERLQEALSNLEKVVNQVASPRLQRIADDLNMTSPEAASELDHALRLEWDIVEGRFVGNLLRSQAAIAENLKALDVPTLGKDILAAERKLVALESREGFCLLKYQGRCFWIDFNYDSKMKCAEARRICESKGGGLANIYSEKHLEIMQGYVRTLIVRQNESPNPAASSWIGLRFSDETDTTLLSNGGKAPYTAWQLGYPTAEHNHCVAVRTTLRWRDRSQGFSNRARTDTAESVICEVAV